MPDDQSKTTEERGDTCGGIFWVRATDGGWQASTPAEACAEIVRLRRGWLRVIQHENSCPATGGGCLDKRCGCIEEMELLAND